MAETVDSLDLTSASSLDDLSEATLALGLARNNAEDAGIEWRSIIRKALAAGQRVADVADAAGVSRQRIYQIRDGVR